MTDARPETPNRLPYDFDLVAARLAEAGATLLALPASGTRPAGYRCWWPAMEGAEVEGPALPPPAARRISEMDQALGWIGLIPAEDMKLRKLVWARTLRKVDPWTGEVVPRLSWKDLGQAMGCADVTAKTWHIRGVEMIVLRLNRPGLCALLAARPARWAAEGALKHAAERLTKAVRLELS